MACIRSSFASSSRSLRSAVVLIGLAVVSSPLDAQLASGAHESLEVARAVDLLPPDLLQSGEHRVLDEVRIDRGFYAFDVESAYGIYRVNSIGMLEIRVHEIKTLAQAISQFRRKNRRLATQLRRQITGDDPTLGLQSAPRVYAAEQVQIGGTSVASILTSPLSTASEAGNQLAEKAERTADELTRRPDSRSVSTKPDAYVNEVSLNPVAGAHKRNVAHQLGLDVYSSNPQVQEFLDAVATARLEGDFNAGVAMIRVPKSREIRVADGRLDAEIKLVIKNLSPEELSEGVDEQLERIGVAAEDRLKFMVHSRYSPTHRTAITAFLDYLRGVKNRGAVIESAITVNSELGAVAHVRLARMLAHYHESVAPLKQLLLVDGQVMAVTEDNRMVVFMPVDIVYWNRQTEDAGRRWKRNAAQRQHSAAEIVLTGSATYVAASGLINQGFEVREEFLLAR